MNVKQLLESSNDFVVREKEARAYQTKWAKTGLLKNLRDKYEVSNMAMLLENQAKRVISEINSTDVGGASFSPGAGEQWAGVALPLVRRVFGEIVAKDFVSVQPMSLPSGLVFYLDFRYGTTKAPFTIGDSVYGSPADQHPNVADGVPSGGLYGAGRFSYSINNSTASALTVTASNSASFADVHYDADYSQSVVDTDIAMVFVPTSSLTRPDLEGIRAFVLSSGSLHTDATLLQNLTRLNGPNIEFFYTASYNSVANAGTGSWLLTYQEQTVDNQRGDFEETASETIAIPEFTVNLKSEAIVAKTRKLKASWTQEFAQDLNAYQNVDAEAELTGLISQYISMEIDLEILGMLIQDAVTKEYWTAENNKAINTTKTDFSTDLGFYNSQTQWFQTLGTKVTKVSNRIHQQTMRGGANFIVCSPTVSTILEAIPGYMADGEVEKMQYNFGVQKVGTFKSQYKVYKNPYMVENIMLLGYKGGQFLESGAVYAPYIPLMMTPLVYDPETFTPRKGVLTRYAKKMIRPEFYAKIYIGGLNTL
jgi:hypothetical protein